MFRNIADGLAGCTLRVCCKLYSGRNRFDTPIGAASSTGAADLM